MSVPGFSMVPPPPRGAKPRGVLSARAVLLGQIKVLMGNATLLDREVQSAQGVSCLAGVYNDLSRTRRQMLDTESTVLRNDEVLFVPLFRS